ncbi:reticulon-4-like isoform X1 [Schistocerca piceifrons]|uniref:reticulon-4-like isoform X1 n=1 Tax=Schistocerca piceifrons TaxID=274613 RepID=UPI001F5EE1A0|nr:reticulon-4-like isoform X1 [Schistocerca piceifrons]
METSATNVEKDKEHASDIVSSAVSTEATGMRRDHESIDDFEHLEPESSPLSETPGKHSFDVNQDMKPAVNSGKDIVSSTIVGKAENNQNSSEFSLLGDSKVGSVEAGNTPETLEEIPQAEFSNKLIDFESHDEQTKLNPKLNVEPEKSLFATTESNKQAPENLFDLPTQKGSGLDLFNRFEISPKGSDASAMSQAFMEMERGGMREEKHLRNEDILQPEVQNIEPKTDELPKQKTEEKKPAEPEFHPAFAHLKDEAHDDDSFKDTDSIPEQIKAEDKFKDFPEEIHASKQDFGFPEPNVHGDFHVPAPATKGSEDNSASDRLEDKKVKETKPDDNVTKHDLELGIPAKVTGKQKLEEKSPVKTKPEVAPPTIKSEAKKTPPKVDDEPVIAPFALASIGLDAWFKPDRLHPKVVELIYWRDPKKSGIVFGSVLGILLSLTYVSLISVIAYLSLAILTGTISFRVYKTVLQAVQKTTSDGHPFKDILELDLTLPQEKVREMTDLAVAHLNAAACELRRLFLVEDLVDSIKFGVLLWCLTYVGAWFNGMTLIIIAFVALFTLPKVYETNKVQIDQNIDLVRSKIAEISSKIKATIRVGGKKPEEKKE